MKTLKLSSIALLLMSIFSCTKSSNTLEQTQQVSKAFAAPTTVHADIEPGLVVNFNPSPGVAGEQVTVTGTFDGSTQIPDCGKLQLFQKIDGNWVKQADVNVSSSVHSVSYQFTPTIVGNDVYEFQLHYIAGNCDGFKQVFSSSYFLDVVEACHGLTITGKASAEPAAEAGYYYFTVNYTVNTCGIEYDHLKTQGGLTAWTSDISNTTAGAASWQVGNSSHPNTIVKWEESAPLAGNTKTYSVTFKKAWSGSGPVELTGAWSVTATDNGTETGTASFDPIVYQ